MAIPKEPRQLMINLMYLVLTAMLALNVSAEIINAFFMIEKGIKHTNQVLDLSNSATIASMDSIVLTKNKYAPLVDAAKEVQTKTTDLLALIDELRNQIITESGGSYPLDYEDKKLAGKPKGKKDKDTPQRILVDQGRGAELRKEILDTKQELVALLEQIGPQFNIKPEEIEALKNQLVLSVDDEAWKNAGKESWEAHVFGYMPVAACYPLFRKFENDVKASESQVITFLAKQIGATEIIYDQFAIALQPNSSYLMKGDKYIADISLAAYSSQADIAISVNGKSLPILNGKAIYTTTASGLGEKSYNASVTITNPQTGEKQTVTKKFFYEVGQPSVTIAADKMNVFYMGVENPISVAAAGISSNSMKVKGQGVKLKRVGNGQYVATTTVGHGKEAIITVMDGSRKAGSEEFRVKRIPDPKPTLGGKRDRPDKIKSGEMKAQRGLTADLGADFDFDARCEIVQYDMYYVPKRQDPVPIPKQMGAKFKGKAATAISKAKPGDIFQFVNIKTKCPGDKNTRKIGSLIFNVI